MSGGARWRAFLLGCAACVASCTMPPTAVRLEVVYDDELGVSALEVTANARTETVRASHELLVLIDDAWAEGPLTIDVTGADSVGPLASGSVTLLPVRGQEVLGRVVLLDDCDLGCANPPSPSCVDEDTILIYQSSGSCSGDRCTYDAEERTCNGCPECDLCDGVSCDAIPSPVCHDETTLRTYAGAGTCSEGACDFPYSLTVCDGGSCLAGACQCVAGWSRERLASGAHNSADVVVGPDGVVHVLFGTLDGLQYAHRARGGSWSVTRLGGYTSHVSLAADGVGGVHAAYREVGSTPPGDVIYGYLGPGETSFALETLARSEYASLAVEEDGTAHVAYLDTSDRITIASRGLSDASWSFDARSPSTTGEIVVVFDDTRGVLHMVYEITSVGLMHAERSPTGEWSDGLVGTDPARDHDVALDGDGGVHVGYVANDSLQHGYRAPGASSFTLSTIDSRSESQRYVKIVVDPSDGVHVIETSSLGMDHHVLAADASSWVTSAVDNGEMDFGATVDTQGDLHVTYFQAVDTEQRYARLRACH